MFIQKICTISFFCRNIYHNLVTSFHKVQKQEIYGRSLQSKMLYDSFSEWLGFLSQVNGLHIFLPACNGCNFSCAV